MVRSRSLCRPASAWRQRRLEVDGALQMMQHVRKRNHIEAVVFDSMQLVDLMAIENQIQIVQLEDITGYNVRVKPLQWRGAASDLENCQLLQVRQILELIPIKFPIPKKEFSIRLQARAVTQGLRPIV